MTESIPDPAAAHLEAVRAMAEQALYRPETLEPHVALPVLAEKALRLLDALDGVLALADQMQPQGPLSSAEERMWIYQKWARMIRGAISAGLLGERGQ